MDMQMINAVLKEKFGNAVKTMGHMNQFLINGYVKAAIANAMEIIPEYLEKTLLGRDPNNPASAGSVFETTVTADDLLNSSWREIEVENGMPGCRYFQTYDLKGWLGVVDLAQVPSETKVKLDDRKNTGFAQALVAGVRGEFQEFSVLITGKEQGKHVVFTVHPGMPVTPSKVEYDISMRGKEITAKDALKLGIESAKIVSLEEYDRI